MLYVFQGTCKEFQDTNRIDTLSSDRNLKINETTGKSKDTEVSSIIWRNDSSRCTILASSKPGRNKYRFIVVPTQGLDRKTSSIYPQLDMENFDTITPISAGSLKFTEPLILGGPITDEDCSGDSIIARSHKKPDFIHLSRVKCFINDGNNWKVLPFSSYCRNPPIDIEYPLVLSRWPDTASSADQYINVVNGYKAVQRTAKRKTSRRRGKCNDLSRTSSSAELNSESGISRTECDIIKDMCTVSVSMPDLRETDSRINQNTIGNDPVMQDLVKCTFLVDTSKNGLLDDGNDSMHDNAVTYPEFYKFLLPDSSSCVSEYGETCSVHQSEKMSNEEDAGLGVLKLELCNGNKDLLSPEDTIPIVVEHSNRTFRNNCVRQAIDGDRTSRSLEKKEYQSRKFPQKSNVKRHSSLGNLNAHHGKENTHSIWRKVERNTADAQNYKSNTQSTNLVPSHHKHLSVPNSCLLYKHEDANMSQSKASKRSKKKKGLRSKQDLLSTCKIESHATEGCSSIYSSIDMKKTSLPSSRQNLAGCESRSFSRKTSGAIFQAKKVESIAYKPLQKPEAVVPVLLSQSPNSVDKVMVFDITKREWDFPPQQCNFHDTPDVDKEDSFTDANIRTVKQSPATYCKEKMHSAVLGETRVNLGVNKFSGHKLEQSGVQLEALKLDEGNLHLEGTTGKRFFSSQHSVHPDEVDQSLKAISEDESSIKKSEMIDASTPEISCNNTATNGLTCQFKNPILLNSASSMVNVSQAVNDAYRAQLSSEMIQSITGSPIAEFEKFIYSASPVLYRDRDISSCKECLPLKAFGAPLCQHETPNISLWNIWRWYEKHGACGMEVRAKDHEHSVRLGMDQLAFRAYFVPFLSAVQLFRKCKAHPNDDTYVYSRETDSNECSSTVGLASALRKLVPQPRSVNSSTFSKMSQVPHKEVSFTSMNDNIGNEQSDLKLTDGLDLLFEYFEYDQPQQRRPLFEMIKELSSGNIPVKSRLHGDPCSLESLGLNDLHPDSWYSVAWYPIYRIPDGKLRAAFLTYHSFGHLVRRSPKHGSLSVDVSIVSPVVGLQSYSAQGECWFRSGQPKGHTDANISHISKERIRTLERTASVMARAAFTSTGRTWVNRQPDYEFFLSRRR